MKGGYFVWDLSITSNGLLIDHWLSGITLEVLDQNGKVSVGCMSVIPCYPVGRYVLWTSAAFIVSNIIMSHIT